MALASSVEEQLVELRAWSFVAVVFWHSVACLAFVFILNTVVGDAGHLEAFGLALVFVAVHALLLHAQRAVLLPAVRSNASVAAAAENGTKVATAYPGRVALQWQRDVLNSVKLACVSVGVGAASFALCAQLRMSSITTDVAAVTGSAAGLVHVVWMLLCDGRYAAFPPLPRPRFYRVKSRVGRVAQEALLCATAALAVSFVWLLVTGRVMMLFKCNLLCVAASAYAVSLAMQFGAHLLAIVYTERFRFLPPPTASAVVGGPEASSALRHALALQTDDVFAQHLAYEDMCFVAEKDGARRAAVFNDEKGLSWSAFLVAALKPVDAALAAAKALTAAELLKDATSAARELRAQQQLATWGIRTLAALCLASRSGDRFGLAHFKEPSLGHVMSRLLSLHLALRATPAPPDPFSVLQSPRAAQLIAMLRPPQPAPATVLADVVSVSLFVLVAAFPEAADSLPANPAIAEQRAALAWFRD